MKGQTKNIVIVVVILVVIFFGYSIFFTGDRDGALLKSESDDPILSSEDGKVILNLLLSLQSLTLEASIFNELSFLSLIDFGQEIPDRPIGRDNPFSPLNQNSDNDAENELNNI